MTALLFGRLKAQNSSIPMSNNWSQTYPCCIYHLIDVSCFTNDPDSIFSPHLLHPLPLLARCPPRRPGRSARPLMTWMTWCASACQLQPPTAPTSECRWSLAGKSWVIYCFCLAELCEGSSKMSFFVLLSFHDHFISAHFFCNHQ